MALNPDNKTQSLRVDDTGRLLVSGTGGGGGGGANLALGTRTATTVPITNDGGTGVTLPVVNTSQAGVMSAAQLVLLNSLPTAAGGGITNLALGSLTASTVPVTNSNGTGFTLPAATTAAAGVLTTAQVSALAGGFPSNLSLGAPAPTTVPVANSNGSGLTLTAATTAAAGVMTAAQVAALAAVPAQANLSLGTLTTSTLPVLNSGGTGVTLPAATTAAAGVLSAADFALLHSLPTSGGGGLTNLALGTITATTVPVTNSNGTGFTLGAATTAAAGVMTAAQLTSLNAAGGPVYTGVWSGKPSASTSGSGAIMRITDIGASGPWSEWVSDGTTWRPRGGRVMIFHQVGDSTTPVATLNSGTAGAVQYTVGGLTTLPANVLQAGMTLDFHCGLRRMSGTGGSSSAQVRFGTTGTPASDLVVNGQVIAAIANHCVLFDNKVTVTSANLYSDQAAPNSASNAGQGQLAYTAGNVGQLSFFQFNPNVADTYGLTHFTVWLEF